MTENRFVMVSEWMENGSINEFLKARADVDRLKLVRPPFEILVPLVTDIRTYRLS